MMLTPTHLAMLLAKAPKQPEWVKEAIDEALLQAKRSPSKYAMVRLTDRVADPEAWARKQEELAAATPKNRPPAERLTPHQAREKAQVDGLRARLASKARKVDQ